MTDPKPYTRKEWAEATTERPGESFDLGAIAPEVEATIDHLFACVEELEQDRDELRA